MAIWLTAVKAIWPHIGTIIAAAAPVFTTRKGGGTNIDLLQQQVEELQRATAQNTVFIKELAEQLRAALAALEEATLANERRLRRAHTVAWIACGVSLIALGVSIFVWVSR